MIIYIYMYMYYNYYVYGCLSIYSCFFLCQQKPAMWLDGKIRRLVLPFHVGMKPPEIEVNQPVPRFKVLPNHSQKEVMRPLYLYYRPAAKP